MRRGYLDTTAGQLHYYDWRPHNVEASDGRIWVGLASVPYSGLFFKTVAEQRPAGAALIGVDLPGYGQSDPLPETPSIEGYAAHFEALLSALGNRPVELVGFHTGTLVALEIARQFGAQVTRLNLIDVPAFDEETREQHLANTPSERRIGHSFESLEPIWQFNVGRHGAEFDSDRGLALMIEDLKAGGGQPLGFRAAFQYDALSLADTLTLPVRIAATPSPLLEPTRALAQALPNCSFDYWPDLRAPVFERGASQVASWLFEAPAS